MTSTDGGPGDPFGRPVQGGPTGPSGSEHAGSEHAGPEYSRSPYDQSGAQQYDEQPQYQQQPYQQPYGQNPYAQPQFPQPQYPQPQYPQPQYPQAQSYPYAPVVSAPTNSKAIVSLVLGCASIALISLYGIGGLAAGVPAIILGFLAKKDIRADPRRSGGDGLATGGIATGLVGTIFGALIGVVMVALLGMASHIGDY